METQQTTLPADNLTFENLREFIGALGNEKSAAPSIAQIDASDQFEMSIVRGYSEMPDDFAKRIDAICRSIVKRFNAVIISVGESGCEQKFVIQPPYKPRLEY